MGNVTPIIEQLEARTPKVELPNFRVGDTLKVYVRIVEGDKERIQAFEGTCIRRKRAGGNRGTFTVRKVSYGVGVERTFPLYSPRIEKVELKAQGRARRARLFYLRDRQGKSARLREQMRGFEGAEQELPS